MDLFFQFHRWPVIIRGKLPKVLGAKYYEPLKREKYLEFLLLHESMVSH
jgi:hypothetical protein